MKLVNHEITGGEVITLVNKELSAGAHTVVWDILNFTSGLYYYKLTAGDLSTYTRRGFTETKKWFY